MPARILVVDDNAAVRNTVRTYLDSHDFHVCGEARDGKEAIQKVRKLEPDVVLLDINMPEMNGIQSAAEILRVARGTKIVFLSVHDTPGTLRATKMWADAFVAKSTIGTALIPTLNRVAGSSLPPPNEQAPMFF